MTGKYLKRPSGNHRDWIILWAVILTASFITDALIRWYPDITRATLANSGEFNYTLITHLFVHDGLRHLIINLTYLYLLGPVANKALRPLPFWSLFLVAGCLGGIANHIIQGTSVAGASAGIRAIGTFAVCHTPDASVYLGPCRRFRWLHHFKGTYIVAFWIAQDGYRCLIHEPYISYSAHITGMITGALLAASMILYKRIRTRYVN